MPSIGIGAVSSHFNVVVALQAANESTSSEKTSNHPTILSQWNVCVGGNLFIPSLLASRDPLRTKICRRVPEPSFHRLIVSADGGARSINLACAAGCRRRRAKQMTGRNEGAKGSRWSRAERDSHFVKLLLALCSIFCTIIPGNGFSGARNPADPALSWIHPAFLAIKWTAFCVRLPPTPRD